jgi:hypothetical protein
MLNTKKKFEVCLGPPCRIWTGCKIRLTFQNFFFHSNDDDLGRNFILTQAELVPNIILAEAGMSLQGAI